MAPASLDLSLDEVIKSTKGESKGSGKWKGGRNKDVPAKEEEMVSLDMSLDELIEKDYLPPKGKSKGWREEDKAKLSGNKNWESQGTWTEKSKAAPGGGGGVATWKGWKDTNESWNSNKNSDSWKVSNDSWKAPIQAWKKADTWGTSTEKWGGGGKKDWSAGAWDDDWKPKPRGDDWSSKWNDQRETAGKGSWDKWNWGPSTSTAWEPPRQAWRPTNEQEREERWNAGRNDAWERRDDHRERGPPQRTSGFESGGYAARRSGYDSYDVRDRRGERRERSRSPPPRRNYFDEVPRGNVILVKNIPLGLDSRDIRDAFQSATGTIESCKLSPDGTARISFARPEDAKKAVATFDHGELNGRIISVHITG